MIPILFEKTESSFTTNGIGRLADAVSCVITEERNGLFELAMEYPMTGIHYADITEEQLIFAQPRPGAYNQAFRIYEVSRPIDGIVTVSARHISYALNKTVVMPYTAGSCTAALAAINDNIVGTSPFTYWTDKTATANFKVKAPTSVRAMLGGTEGSILDTFGTGEYEWDMYTVKLHLHRGHDSGVTIRYGKNLTDIKNDTSIGSTYTAIVPYYTKDNTTVTLPEKALYGDYFYDYAEPMIIPVDFSEKFADEIPTVAQLRTVAQAYLDRSDKWRPSENIEISFIDLAQTEEYKNIAVLERVNLCDTVTVIHPQLGVSATAKVVKAVYDVLAERYNSLEIGDATTNLSEAVAESIGVGTTIPTKSFLEQAVEYATSLITGGLGGHVVINRNANGEPEEILIMDTDDTSTAVNVWRWNMGGLGHSSTGYNGPYNDVAITQDGRINANYIATGVMDANLIRAGVIRDQQGLNYWDLESGVIHLDASAVVDTSNFVTRSEINVVAGEIKSEVISEVGSGIFFNCVPIDNGNGTTTIEAHLYANRVDVTTQYDPYQYQWYKKTEDGEEYIGYGYTITVTNDDFGYGGVVIGTLVIVESVIPAVSQGLWVFETDIYPVFGYSSN